MNTRVLSTLAIILFGFVANAQWVQIGSTITNDPGSYITGRMVSMSTDGNIVAVGTNAGGPANPGYVRILQNINNLSST